MLSSLFIAALWSPDLLAFVCDVYGDFVTFPFGILRQMWYLIVLIPNPCCLSYFYCISQFMRKWHLPHIQNDAKLTNAYVHISNLLQLTF